VERLRPELEEATRSRQQAEDQATRSHTLLEQARQHLEELTQLDGAKVCRHCGQPLTAAHLQDEKCRREADVAAAEQQFQQAVGVQEAGQKRHQELAVEMARLEKRLQDAREEFREHRQKAEQARQDAERLMRECGRTYQELPDPFRAQISPDPPNDWLDTTYPSAADLAEARKQASGLASARRTSREAEKVQQQWDTLKGQQTTAQQNLERLRAELPADRAAVRQQHVRLEAEEHALDQNLAALRVEILTTQEQLDRLSREREQLHQQRADIQSRLGTEETTRRLCRQTLDRARQELPASWQALAGRAGLAELHDLNNERDHLIERKTDERGKSLEQARLSRDLLHTDLANLERQQEQYPEEARQDPALLQALVQPARQAHRAREEELVQSRQEKAQLEGYRRQREQLEQEALQAEKTQVQAKMLADLLGRERLQLHLVRQAERQVVDYANAVLDRLSGGQLYLKLCGEAGGDGSSAKALELETHNRSTGDRPINVAFLSGSQKFRVAVSLALGIGQYASRRHRPIESVIIDEGFGCLDKEGRQAMIQEMLNLRDQLKCILLVSHQEEFADAFADGYLFELKDRTTRATRFQR
jgi:DNA repair exonuclease SbcCD ATPase subunit